MVSATGRSKSHTKSESPDKSASIATTVEQLLGEGDRLRRVDARRALNVARRARRLANACRDSRLIALSNRALAHALRSLSRNREALPLYRRACRQFTRLGMAVEAARTDIGRIDCLMYLGRYAEAIQAGKAARRVFVRHHEGGRVMRLDLNIGNIHHRLDRHREALRCYDRARRAVAADGDPFAAALIDYNRANALTMLSRHDEAEAIYIAVVERCQAEGLDRIAAHARYNLAYLRFLECRYDDALDLFATARQHFEGEGDASFVGSCDLDRGEVCFELNQIHAARRLARGAGRIFARHAMRAERARALWLEGVAAGRLGRRDEAFQLLAASRRAFTAEGNTSWVGMTELARAALHLRSGRRTTARRLAQAAARRFRTRGLVMRQAQATLLGARAAFEAGQLPEARRAVDAARRAVRRLPAPWLECQWHHLRARLAEAAGRRGPALQACRRALAALERIRAGVQLDERKISLLTDKLEVYEDAVRIALSGARPRLDLAFEFIERSKSRALLDALHATDPRVVPDRSRTARTARAARLEGEILGLYNTINAGGRSGSRDAGRTARGMLRRVRSLERQLERVAAVRAGAPAHATTGPDLTHLTARLGPDRALIEFFGQHGDISALTISRHGRRHHPHLLSGDEVRELLGRLHLLIHKFDLPRSQAEQHEQLLLAAIHAVLERIGTAIRPVLPARGSVRSLLIVPHGALHYLPLHAALVDGEPLCESFEIEHAPSAGIWLTTTPRPGGRCAAPHGREARGEVLLVGPADDRLPGARQEIEDLCARFPGATVLTGRDADRATVMSHLARSGMVHFATHCMFRPDRPDFSGLELADGWLRVPDLAGLRMRADLVTLSACATGPGHVRSGDEMIGLLRGFLAAGASRVVASLWPVSDEHTRAFMSRFYDALDAPSPGVAGAMRRTMQAMRRDKVHPYVWAPFVLYGRGREAEILSQATDGRITVTSRAGPELDS